MKKKIQTINGWTKQSMIEHIKKNFTGKSLRRGTGGSHPFATCAYRGDNGEQCAMGLFIPQELYRSRMEGRCASDVCMIFPEIAKLIPLQPQYMNRLQSVHDNSNITSTLDRMLYWIDSNIED